MTDSTPKNVIQLVRVSTKAQAAEDRAGIAAQQDACERIAKSYGLNIASRIELVDVSGAAIMTTPEMQQLIRALYSRTFHGVIVKEFSRALRPENYDFYLFQVMTETRSTLYTANGPMEPWTSQGRMMVAFNGVIAANELETIRARMQGGKEAKRRQGKHPGNEQSLPYGVGYSEDRGWYYEAEAQNVREMFRLYLSGVPLVEICGKLGLKRHLVTYALSNRIYTGVRVYDHKSDPSVRRFTADGRQKNSPRIRRPPEEIIEKRVISPPLISDAEFERVQDMMASRARRHVRSAPRMQFVYGGYLTCSICGSMVHVAHQREGYYVCGAKLKAYRRSDQSGEAAQTESCESRYMKRERLEQRLDGLFGSKFRDRSFLEGLASELERRSRVTDSGARLARLEADLRSLMAKRERIIELFIDGVLDPSQRAAKLAGIEQQVAALRDGIMREMPEEPLSAEQLAYVLQPFAEWRHLSRDQKRRVLAASVPDVLVANYTISGVLSLV